MPKNAALRLRQNVAKKGKNKKNPRSNVQEAPSPGEESMRKDRLYVTRLVWGG